MSKKRQTVKLLRLAYARISLFTIFALLAMTTVGSAVYTYTRVVTPERALAATSSNLNYQARLYNANGSVVADGFYNIEFKLYNVSSGGSSLWSEAYYDSNGGGAGNDNRVRVVNGYLSVNLASQTAFPSINWDQDLWLTMNVGGTAQTATPTYDGEMSPRIKLTAVPYAFQAANARKLNDLQGANAGILEFTTLTGNRTITLPDSSGTVCLQSSAACGFLTGSASDFIQNGTSLQTANFNIRSSAAANIGAIIQGHASQTADIFQVKAGGGGTLLNIGASGATTFTNSTNSTTAFQIQNAAAAPLFNVDTSITLNLVNNGSMENNTTNWAARGSATISQVSTQQWQGNNSLQVATTAVANDGAQYSYTFTASTEYTFSFFARSSSGSITDIRIGRQDNGSDINCGGGLKTFTTSWERFSCTFTTGGTISGSNIFIKQTGTAAQTFFIDGFQIQTGSFMTGFDAGGQLQVNGLINSPLTIQTKADSIALQVVRAVDGGTPLTVGGSCVAFGNVNCNGSTVNSAWTIVANGTTAGFTTNSTIALSQTSNNTDNFLVKSLSSGSIAAPAVSDVVILVSDPGNGNRLSPNTTTVARDPRVAGVATTVSGGTTTFAIAGIATVNATSAAVNVGDQLVTSTTTGQVMADNNATIGILGYAVSSKAGGSTGTVKVWVRPVGGQSTPRFQNTADSNTAFVVQNASSQSLFTVDTTNRRVTLDDGQAANANLFIVDSSSAVPTGVNGGIYYDTGQNQFQCYENGTWKDCIAAGAATTLQDAYVNSSSPATITTTSATKDIIFKSGTGFNSSTMFRIQNASDQNLFVADTANQRVAIGPAAVPANGVLTVGTDTTAASGGVYFGTDTSLYRSGSNALTTGGAFTSAGLLTGQAGATVAGAAISLNDSSNFATNINTGTSTGAVSIGNNTGNTAITIDSGTSAINIGTGAQARSVNIATGGAAQTLIVGSTNTTSTTTIQAGSGGINLNNGTVSTNATTLSLFGTNATTINFGAAASSGGINFAGGSGSSGCSIDGSNGNLTCSGNFATLGTGTITAAGLLTGNAGLTVTGGASSLSGGIISLNNNSNFATNINTGNSTGTVSIGNNTGNTTIVIDSGTSAINIGTGAQARSINIGTGGAGQAVTLGSQTSSSTTTIHSGTGGINLFASGSSNTGVVVKHTSNSTNAFLIQNSAGTPDTLFRADTTSNRIIVGNATASSSSESTLFVVDSSTTSNLPTGVNGGIVYDTTTNKLKIYENGQYKVLCNQTDQACGSATSTTLQDVYNNSSSPATITTTSATKDIVFKSGSGFNSTGLFQIQNASSQNLFVADTTNQRIAIGPAAVPANGALTVGTDTTAASGGIYFGTDTNLYRSASGVLKTDGNFAVGGVTFTNPVGGSLQINGATGNVNFEGRLQLKGNGINSARIEFGAASDVDLFRNGSNELKTDSGFTVQTTSDSATGFQVQNAAGTQVVNVDTTNSNLVTNPSFETNTTGWVAHASSGAPARDTTEKYIGNASGKTAATAANHGLEYSVSLTNGQTYALSAWVKYSATSAATIAMGRVESSSDQNCTLTQGSPTISTSGWTYVSCTFVYGGTTGATPIYIKQTDAVTRTIFIDGVQLLNQSTITPYRIGTVSLNGIINSPTVFQNQSNSNTALQIQSSDSDVLFRVDTLNNRLYVGNATASSGADSTLLVIDSSSTGNLPTGVNGGIIYDSTTNKFKVYENGSYKTLCNTTDLGCGAAGASQSLQDAYNNSSTPATIETTSATKDLIIKSGATFNSASMFQIQSSGSDVLFKADTTNNRVYVGNATASSSADSTLLVIDSSSTSNLPTGVNGGIIYDSTTSKFKIYENGAYKTLCNTTDLACGSAGVAQTLQDAYNNSSSPATIETTSSTKDIIIKSGTGFNSSSLFQIQNASAQTLFIADTSNQRIAVGPAAAAANSVLTVGTNTTAASGGIYFGTDTNLYRSAAAVLRTDGSIQLGEGANQTFNVQGRTTNAAGRNLTVSAGNAGSGGSAFAGGVLTLQGGNADGTGNASGGDVLITGGTGVGTGTRGLVVIDTPAFTTTTNTSCSSSCTITQANVDSNGNVIVNATAGDIEITLPDPTNTTAGRIVYITAANGSSDFTLLVNGGGTGNQIAMRQNTSATMIWNGSDWTAAGASSSTTLQAAYNNTLTSAGGAEIVLNNTASSNGLTIRNNATNPIMDAVFEVQSSIGNNLLSVNNNAVENVSNGGAETAGGTSSTFPSNTWSAAAGGGTVSRNTTLSNVATGQASVQVATTAANHGTKNDLTANLATNTTYQLSLTGKLSAGSFTTLDVYYSRDGGTTMTACATAQTFVTTGWSKITCTFTTDGTTATNPDIIIRQSDGTARTFYIDNLSVTLSTTVSTPPNVQIGGGIYGGTPTLLTLDRSTSPPVANGNDVFFGSMYYDTTSGRIQCYEADGWGACGSAPDNFVNLVPEYAGAVLNGTGIGTMSADFCANSGALSVNSSLCASGQALNYYKWTSPQATQQTYSIYVTYQLPAAFKHFANDNTVTLNGRTDSTTNGAVTYQMYRSEGGSLTACGTETAVTTSANVWQTVGIDGNEFSGCGFSTSSANNNVIFKINVKANSNANVYVGTLSFTTIGQ